MGNIGSVVNAFKMLSEDVIASESKNVLEKLDAYVLPGVGAFPQAIRNFHKNGFGKFLDKQVIAKKKPFLGICLGMQLLANSSDEQGFTEGLGWIDSHVVILQNKPNFPIPHVGWNDLKIKNNRCLLQNIDEGSNFYFDHSFEFISTSQKVVLASSSYDKEIISVVRKDHIFGTQFHPEKSQRNGLKLLRNFINIINQM